jgi:hypothetical protein
VFTYCPDCGTQTAAVGVDHDAGIVTCPDCGVERRFESRPLHVVTGASGTGKTTAWRRLVGTVDVAVLDWDIMTFDDDDGYGDHLRGLADDARLGFWLRLCANLGRSGVPVLWFAGDLLPRDINARPESRYFPTIRYCALTCDTETLRDRLRNRRGWAGAREEGHPWADLDRQTAINEEQREAGADPESPVETLDTGALDPEETAARLREWVQEEL